ASGIIRADSINFDYWNPQLDGKFVKAKTHEEASQKAPKKPLLVGLDSQENILFTIARFSKPGRFYPMTDEKAANFSQEDFRNGLTHVLKHDGAYGRRADEAVDKILAFYEQQKEKYSTNKYLNAFVQFFSDLNFNVGSLREAKLKAAAGHQVYFYIFDYPALSHPLLEGAGHGSEAFTIFGRVMEKIEPLDDPAYITVKNGFLELVTTFAVDGAPKCQNLPIPPVTAEKTPYIEFGTSGITVKEDLWPERLAFWDDLAKEYGFDWVTASWTSQDTRNEL
uniref:Carboxylesterase type B domain-containing protein n=1 Tax=Panagrolaimus sp. JU765 TaxID=591449 RepID=A0AC34RN58_9BILA